MSTLENPTSTDRVEEASDPSTPAVFSLSHRFLDELPELCLEWSGADAPDPQPVVLNEELAADLALDVDRLGSTHGLGVLSGARAPRGSRPVALGYAGHQFGNYSPRLGDGRALLLGELDTPRGELLDVHLKGSGRTPFARGGDGRATIGPMLREHLISEFMHAAGVPTTRSLAVVTTGEQVRRERMEPGAVLTRVAASHVRVGTFEYALRLANDDSVDDDLVVRLADHSIARHYPDLDQIPGPAARSSGGGTRGGAGRYRAFLAAVVESQARLVAEWMQIGFIHGVMNTDNMAISGEGIDYGPCAFMDHYDPATVFSSIDHGGRYAFGNQPAVASWNLARLAETLLEAIAADEGITTDEAVEVATGVVRSFADRFQGHLRSGMAAKLGLTGEPEGDPTLFDDLLAVMHEDSLDWTTTFRSLAGELRRGDSIGGPRLVNGNLIGPGTAPPSEAFGAWSQRWRSALGAEGRDPESVAAAMDAVNPLYVPRNHIVDEALEAANAGDLVPFERLMDILADPYTEREGLGRYAEPAPPGFTAGFRTFCGT